MYKLLKFVLLSIDAEKAHGLVFSIIAFFQRSGLFLWWVRRQSIQDPSLVKVVSGLMFRNPVGIAAGFDKNARLLPFLDALGIGSVTVGTVTPLPQRGKLKPRLFRLTKAQAILNRMGFNNDGMDIIYNRVKRFYNNKSAMQIGVSIGPNQTSIDTSHEAVINDYITLFERFTNVVNYFEINVSSPNTKGLRALQEDEFLMKLFEALKSAANTMSLKKIPIFLKISPDVSNEDFVQLVQFVNDTPNCSGIILSNTTLSRESLKKLYTSEEIESFREGGLSGPMLFIPMSERVAEATEITQKPIIAVGGICSPERAEEIIEDGASLIQLYTGLVYEGPGLVKQIIKKLKK